MRMPLERGPFQYISRMTNFTEASHKLNLVCDDF